MVVAFGSAVLQLVWLIFWAFTVGAVYFNTEAHTEKIREIASGSQSRGQQFEGDKDGQQGAVLGFSFFFLLISLFWTSQVLKNVAHTTTAGVVAAWWFQTDNKAPTRNALSRALTTSFGSICLGSLIVAVLKAIRAVCRMARESARKNRDGLFDSFFFLLFSASDT